MQIIHNKFLLKTSINENEWEKYNREEKNENIYQGIKVQLLNDVFTNYFW